MGKSTVQPWQTDWRVFVEFLGEQVRRGAGAKELASAFACRPITWTGTLRKKFLEEPAPGVTVTLPKAKVEVDDATSVELGGLAVPAARDAMAAWKSIPIRTRLSFSAVFKGNGIFPPVDIKRLSSGRTVILIGVGDGRPVSW